MMVGFEKLCDLDISDDLLCCAFIHALIVSVHLRCI
jgi:hypothetical protein